MSKIKLQSPDWLISQQIKQIIAQAGDQLGLAIDLEEIHLEHPVDEEHGDYATNLALAEFEKFKVQNEKLKVENPFDLAKSIAEKIPTIHDPQSIIRRVAAVSPGFINFFLNKDVLIAEAQRFIDQDKFKQALSEVGKDKTMIIDYSSPNIAKRFGIGHLRSTNIGQAIYNLYSFLGWQTIGDNHLGDWGTQFGKLIVAIKKWWDKDLPDLTISELEKLYVKFHQQAEANPELEEEARKWFKKLEQENEQAKKIWQVCVDISLKEFDRVYDLLGIEIDVAYGEAFYFFDGWMDKVLEDLDNQGLIKQSQGAKVVEIKGYDTPAMVIKSDGATTYLTRDLATLKFRKENWNPDLVVYEVGSEQKFHFNQVFQLSEELGYIDKEKLIHIAHGMIRLKNGKLSTRKGETIHLEQVLDQAVARAKQLSDADQPDVAQAVGIGAVKFNDLKQAPEKEVVFDWDQMLSLEGYSGPYLQYSYARAQSVLAKSTSYELPATSYDLNEEELALLRTFYIFPEVLISAAEDFGPHHLCQYLFDLAQKFNLFYQKHRIIGPRLKAEGSKQEEVENFRLFLTQVTARILEQGLKLLGIRVLTRM